MSLKKDKYVENAQKLIIKGQFEKAAFELEQAVECDPSDLKVRQKLAEILIRANRPQDAVTHYETIGKAFANSSFYLKAIAVYKQIQKITPDNTKITLTLAELNVSHGLIGNALAEFSTVVNQYLKAGKQTDAIQLLERMLEIDPTNLNTMLKIAETCMANGNSEAAYDHYCTLARQLWTHPDKSTFHRLADRISTLFPDRDNVLNRLITAMLDKGETAAAVEKLKEIIAGSPDNLTAWYLMVDTMHRIGDMRQLQSVLEKIRARFPDECRPVEELEKLSLHRTPLAVTEPPAAAPEPPPAAILEVDSHADEHEPDLPAEEDADEVPEMNLPEIEPEEWEEEIELGFDDEIPAAESGYEAEVPDAREPEPVEQTVPEAEPLAAAPQTVPEHREYLVELPTRALPEDPDLEAGLMEALSSITGSSDDDEEESDGQPVILHEMAPANPDADQDFTTYDEAGEPVPTAETDIPERIVLTIDNPLPLAAFLPQMPVETVAPFVPPATCAPEHLEPVETEIVQPSEPEPSPLTKPVQLSPWDEVFPVEPTAAGPAAAVTPPPPADELVDLLVGHLESFDWGATDNRTNGFNADIPAHELQVELLPEPESHEDHEPEMAFELNDLASFAEALFGDDPAGDHPQQSDEYSFDSMLSAFKKGVDEQLDESDTETRYSLGIAYKEMGLYDEAIQELQAAAHDPARTADCIALQGICLREKGDVAAAEKLFREGFTLPALTGEALLNLKYELAQLLEQSGRPEAALAEYREIAGRNPSYRDVPLQISRLSGDDDLDILIELSEDD